MWVAQRKFHAEYQKKFPAGWQEAGPGRGNKQDARLTGARAGAFFSIAAVQPPVDKTAPWRAVVLCIGGLETGSTSEPVLRAEDNNNIQKAPLLGWQERPSGLLIRFPAPCWSDQLPPNGYPILCELN